MTRRGRGLVLPVALIAVGVIFLLVNTGFLTAEAVQRLGDMWPLILVVIGVQLILDHLLPRPKARTVGLLAALFVVAAAITYVILAPAAQPGTEHQETSEALNGLAAGKLELAYGGATIDLQSAALGSELFRASVDYPSAEQPPDVSLDRTTGSVHIRGGGPSGFHLFGSHGTRHIVVTLSTRIPWSVQVAGGAADLHLQLAELQLSSLEISGGASRLDVTLPAPRGTLAVNISGGVSSLTIHAPTTREWKVSVSGGLSSLTVNGALSGGVGDVQRASPGYDGASDRLQLDVSGGVSRVDLMTG